MLFWGDKMAPVINIHAKFRITLVMNDGSPWLSLGHKYLRGRGLLQNRLVNIIKDCSGWTYYRAGLAHF